MLCLIQILSQNYTDLTNDFFKADHVYQIRALETPVFCDDVGTITRLLNTTHAGLGFIDMNDSSELVFEYNMRPDYIFKPIDFLRPRAILNESTGLYDFIWDFNVTVIVQDALRKGKCGWEKNIVVASGVSGVILNAWQHDYAQWFQDQYHTYTIQEMWYADNLERFDNQHGNQCHDFVWWGMQSLQNTYGVKFNGKEVRRVFVYYLLNRSEPAPQYLNLSNQADNLFIKEFYDKFNAAALKYPENELIERWSTGKLLENNELALVNHLQHQYFFMKTNEKKFLWYESKPHVVPGDE
ncbi:Conserved_hypothetical protein [Hexamita inflata]|uniref:Uncharacterized protein n=1 Tax=Hexamita inflata TaxID=28002 RepID=A0AA86UUJ0_9EUKA|nr:Conserved hypothetical protein [Hexamita inflata]